MTFYLPIEFINSNIHYAPLGFEDEFRQRIIIDKIQNMDTSKSLKKQEDKFIKKYFVDIFDAFNDVISQRYDRVMYRDEDHSEDEDHTSEDWNQYLASWDDKCNQVYEHREVIKTIYIKYFTSKKLHIYESLDFAIGSQSKNIKGYKIRMTNLDKVLKGEHVGRKQNWS